MNDKIEIPQRGENKMDKKKEFVRPNLTEETLGGVKLSKKIGSGGFGDVYISPDHNICVKVIFRGAFPAREYYERELESVQCISSCIRKHCGIMKFLGGGTGKFNASMPFVPHYIKKTKDFEMYPKFPVITEHMEYECRDWKKQKSQEFFFYLMMAADNLAKEPEYCPDTLENRCRRGRLEKMSDAEKIQVIGEIIDSLLFLYNLEVRNESNLGIARGKEIFHIAHGDIKPANIFFVNGHAQLGDIGATMRIDPTGLPSIGTLNFMLPRHERKELELRCVGDYFAYSVYSDIYALGKTAEYMMLNGREEDFSSPYSALSMIRDRLCSFHVDLNIRPRNVVNRLKEFKHRFIPEENLFENQSCYGTAASEIMLNTLYEFTRWWSIVDAESENRFRVTNPPSNWGHHSDVLLAERFSWNQNAEIREKVSAMLRDGQSDGRPILIYKLKRPRKLIVLSHSSAPFSPSEEAMRQLQQEIDKYTPDRG